MGYHVIDPAAISPSPDHPCDRRSITDAAGLSTLAVAVYELAPGEDLATTYHYHERREEALFVVDGELHVQTPEQEFEVAAGQVFVVEPESPIRPYNPATAAQSVRVLGAGAPLFDIGQPYTP